MVYSPESYAPPNTMKEFQASMWTGLIKASMDMLFENSSENHVDIHKLGEKTELIATKAFKEGGLKLVGLSNNLSIVKTAEVKENLTCIHTGAIFDIGGVSYSAVVKKQCTWPNEKVVSGFARVTSSTFLVKFWLCGESVEMEKCNMERRLEEHKLKVGSKDVKLQIPVLVNTVKITQGDRLIVAKTATDATQKKEEPTAKRLKIMEADGAADAAIADPSAVSTEKGKGKGKGKGRGKTGKGRGK